MADYECYPTWLTGSAGVGNVDPAELPISNGLAAALLQWAQIYDGTLDRDDPASSGFPDADQEADFYVAGHELARRLAAELSGRYTVEYFDGRTGRLVPASS
ncbi:hypothetical protein ACIBVK_28625 [Micromonospora echinofusca]|uniref:hypothetical protein n=1 Tax=Micromonospora echinofusca TaxID=47858 RepID=UPI00202004F3|nr:hypothetical protein [Micromonospora sp. MSM11]MCL7456258.1 hypothetical protein [Micromonospora sp. MSM11]